MAWKIPLQQLAKQFCLSDVGLAKICKKHQIPVPGRGYWRKIETGKKASQKLLPKLKDASINIEIVYREKEKEPQVIYSDAFNEIAKKESEVLNKITVSYDNIIKHKYALRAEKLLINAKSDNNNIIHSRAKCPPPIYVTKNSLPRTIQIIDTLLSALKNRNFSIQWPKENTRYFSTTIENIEIGFSISEKFDRKDHKPTKEEIAEQKEFSWRTPPKWDYHPNGKLCLNLLTPKNVCNIKHHWNDGKIKRIENQFNEFIIEIYKVAEEYKLAEERKKQWEIEAAERQKQYIEIQRQEAEYKRKVDYMFSAIESWKQSKLIEDFCQEITDSSKAQPLTENQISSYKEIINYLKEYTKQINPILSFTNFLNGFGIKYKWSNQCY